MKRRNLFKCIMAAVIMTVLTSGYAFASGDLSNQGSFPFTVELGQDAYDKLCYAGHVTGGGMFYSDGYMLTPEATFTLRSRYGTGADTLGNLSVEIDLIYENSDNTGCVREVLRKYDFGDVRVDREYPLLTENAIKTLKQRRKLYSSDVMSVKMILTYRTEANAQKKQTFLLYLAKDGEYNDKRNVLAAPPETE